MEWEIVIGLEVHVQLNLKTKAFCRCENRYGAEPNTLVCPVCLGYPGALPVLNEGLVRYAIRAGLATHSGIRLRSTFSRKNYFYPDLPKGYQISQYDDPICYDGHIDIETDEGPRQIGLIRIHMEEDSGKSMHDASRSLIDLNRSGVALLEIVSKPDIKNPAEAYAYLTTLKQRLKYIGISDCNMEEGSLRCDANVSVMPKGSSTFGTRTELKNLNSFRNVEKALQYEAARQIEVLESGGRVDQCTLLWDEGKQCTRTMRSKEDSHDYRYFPEPDLLPVLVSEADISGIRDQLPEMPDARARRFEDVLGLTKEDAAVLTQEKDTADYFEAVAERCGDARLASKWIQGEMLRLVRDLRRSIDEIPVSADALAELLAILQSGDVTVQTAKAVLDDMASSGESAAHIIESKGLKQIGGGGELEKLIDEILENCPSEVEKYRAGKVQLLGFFMGQLMKATQGRADQKAARELFQKKLEA